LAINQSVAFFVDGRERKLLKHDKKERKIVEIRREVEKAANRNPGTDIQHKADHKQQQALRFSKLFAGLFSFFDCLFSTRFLTK
jgi:hypothetical protein